MLAHWATFFLSRLRNLHFFHSIHKTFPDLFSWSFSLRFKDFLIIISYIYGNAERPRSEVCIPSSYSLFTHRENPPIPTVLQIKPTGLKGAWFYVYRQNTPTFCTEKEPCETLQHHLWLNGAQHERPSFPRTVLLDSSEALLCFVFWIPLWIQTAQAWGSLTRWNSAKLPLPRMTEGRRQRKL